MTTRIGFKIRRPSTVVRVQPPSRLLLTAIIGALCGAPWSTAAALDLSERDKQLHLAGGFAIGLAASAIAVDERPHWSPWTHFAIGVLASSAAGIAKEVIDANGGGTKDSDDALATSLGGALGAGIVGGYTLSVGYRGDLVFGYSRRF